jgi:hypothetical protein
VELSKLGKRRYIYLLKPKWPKMNTGKAHLKGECFQKDLLMLEAHEEGRKKYENSSSRKKMRKYDLIASSPLKRGGF